MLQLLVQRCFLHSILNFFEHIDEDRLATELSFELFYYFEERGLEDPEVDTEVVIQISELDSL